MLIRPARVEDLPALTEIYNHYVRTSPVTFDVEPFAVEDRREWLSHYAEDGPYRLLVAEGAASVLGYATSSPFRHRPAYRTSVETSVYCHPNATGRGVGTRLYERLFEEIAGQGLHRAYAGITMPNDASLALHRRFGFREVGTFREVGHKFDRYWDVLWLEKPL
jgi:phosphinothricin acetyltransferase